MRSLLGVQQRVTGTVEVLGLPAGHRDLRRRVGYMSQGAGVFGDLTVRQNLRYFARLLGADEARVEELVGETDLAEQADQMVSTLSGGQAARVSLAVALLGAPELLVLDEPTVGLDPVLRQDLWTLFRRLAEAGTTLLVSSHVMDEATRCDHLVLMRDGRVLAAETPARLLKRTDAADTEAAFLTLIRSSDPAAAEAA